MWQYLTSALQLQVPHYYMSLSCPVPGSLPVSCILRDPDQFNQFLTDELDSSDDVVNVLLNSSEWVGSARFQVHIFLSWKLQPMGPLPQLFHAMNFHFQSQPVQTVQEIQLALK